MLLKDVGLVAALISAFGANIEKLHFGVWI
jgi:hypothetical protein